MELKQKRPDTGSITGNHVRAANPGRRYSDLIALNAYTNKA